jgi:hypothetical protein
LITAYAVHRPDDHWSILIINKDEKTAHPVALRFRDASGGDRFFAGEVEMASFGGDNYAWHADGAKGFARPDGPPRFAKLTGGAAAHYPLPPASLVVLTGKL